MKYLQHVEVKPSQWKRIWEETSKQALAAVVERVRQKLYRTLNREARKR